YQMEKRFIRKDGTVIWTNLAVGCVRNADGRVEYVVTLLHDISSRKQAEADKEKLEAQNRQLQKSESLGRMAGAIAHHFNNQLMVVMGNLELVMEDLLPRGEDPLASLNAAMQAGHRAAEVSGLMLTYLGQTPAAHVVLDLSGICRQSLPVLGAGMPKSMLLETDVPRPGPAISANANQLQQVLANLLTNAWEASKAGGTLHLTVTTVAAADIPAVNRFPIGCQPQDRAYACLAVTDTGSGIAAQDIEKLFDPFFSTKFTGRGLGLPVVLGIVRAHEGLITVESQPGHGSIFRVFLPLAPAPAAAAMPATAGAGMAVGPTLSGLSAGHAQTDTVLVVEDDAAVRHVAAGMLARLGFAVLVAPDGVEALALFRQRQAEICCVLCDLSMPRMDGWATLTALRQLAPGLPVVLASGYDEAQVMAGEHAERPQVFLGKPYQMQALRAALRKAMADN
ncbi:MAG: ATP-binding protein, partial [bacterium]|nr:ATP-binding protein [bacterium]